jgi:hypothetical protein
VAQCTGSRQSRRNTGKTSQRFRGEHSQRGQHAAYHSARTGGQLQNPTGGADRWSS